MSHLIIKLSQEQIDIFNLYIFPGIESDWAYLIIYSFHFCSVVFIRMYFHMLFGILVNLVSTFRFVMQIHSGSIHSCSHTRLKSHYLWPCRGDVCSSDP